MNPGDDFVIQTENDSLKISSINTAINEMHSLFFKYRSNHDQSIVDDFLEHKNIDKDIEQARDLEKFK